MVAEGHGGERKQKKDCLQEIQKAGFRPTLSSFFSPLWAWKLLLFIGMERVQSCLQWGKISALDSTWAIQTVGSKWAPRTAKFADCPRCTLWANKRSRFKPFRPDRTTPRDNGVPGGHFGACFVGFGCQTRQKTRPEVGHSGSSVEKKMNSIRRRVAWSCPFFWIKTAPFW